MKGNCEICHKVESKYKCPCCLILYCSLGCYRHHKEFSCEKKLTESGYNEQQKSSRMKESEVLENGHKNDKADNITEYDEEDWVSPEKLQILGDSKELREQLSNEHLRKLLVAIDSAADPGEKLDQAMQIPIFTEFMDVCMKVIEGEEEN